jgi:3-oxoacyl-[acyl-carrier protein] reductase
MISIDLKDKTALVCGATAGIGYAIAENFAMAGARVVVCARNESKLQDVVVKLNKLNGLDNAYVVADYSESIQVSAAAQLALDQYGPTILVNNTGGPPAGLAHEASLNEYLSAFQQHLINNQIMTSALVSQMKKEKFGRIINIISTSVKAPLANLGVSNTVRGAVGNWSKTLANELGSFGITVNNILPGATGTQRLTNIINNKSSKTGSTVEEVSNKMLSAIPASRFADPNEPAYAACFLASNLASYINGTNIVVDGGRTPCL